jgi:hypothetical protein
MEKLRYTDPSVMRRIARLDMMGEYGSKVSSVVGIVTRSSVRA